MPRSKTGSSTPRRSELRLSEVARHVVIPSGIETTAWPRVEAQCAQMGVRFDGWQRGIGQVALGKRKNGKYAATVGGVVLSIPRQVGKTFLVGMIIIALCILIPNLTVLWTAHRTRTSTKTFKTMQGYVKRKRIAQHLKVSRSDGIRAANGEQEIEFANGSIIMFGAREGGFGRGFDKVDIEVFDEAQILGEKALEDMVAATNQSEQASGALLFFMGTPPRPVDLEKGDEFGARRSRALGGRDKDTVYVEFSADDDADPDDQAQWELANPSYPDRTPLESMQRMRANLTSDDSFRREALGIWATSSPRVIDEQSWSNIGDAASMATDRLVLAVDVAPNRSVAAVAIAGKRPDGLWHVELEEHREGAGADWVVPYVVELASKNRLHAVVVDEMSGLVKWRNKVAYLGDSNVKVTLAGAEGRDMVVACAQFYDAIMSPTPLLRHTDQPQVNVALSVARKRPLAGGWAWNRKDEESDITPIVAETLALWGARNDTVKRPGRRTSERTAVIL